MTERLSCSREIASNRGLPVGVATCMPPRLSPNQSRGRVFIGRFLFSVLASGASLHQMACGANEIVRGACNMSLKLGRSLQWDGAKEMIVGDAEANKHLSRKYRGAWEYPKA